MALEDTKAIRDQIIANVHGMNVDTMSTTALNRLTSRIVETMSDVLMGLWALRDFTFRYLEVNPFSMTAGENDVDLPATWVNEGKQGGIWRVGDPTGRIVWRPLHQVTDMLRRCPNERGIPRFYAISGLRKLRMFPPSDRDIDLSILMLRGSLTLIVDPDEDADPPEVDGMTLVSELMRLAVYRGTAGEESRRKGDIAEYSLWTRRYDTAVFDLICSEQQGSPEPGFLPRYAGGASVFPDGEE